MNVMNQNNTNSSSNNIILCKNNQTPTLLNIPTLKIQDTLKVNSPRMKMSSPQNNNNEGKKIS